MKKLGRKLTCAVVLLLGVVALSAFRGTHGEAACSHRYTRNSTVVSPTCTSKGYTKVVCVTCGTQVGKTNWVNARGHSYAAATCTMPQKCSRCGSVTGQPLKHNYAAATCTAPKTCTRCPATTGKKLEHSWRAATCTKPKTCDRCKTTTGEKLGHNWAAKTCSAPKTCKRCYKTSGEKRKHSYSEATCIKKATCKYCGTEKGSLGNHKQAKAATCTAKAVCMTCGKSYGKVLGHIETGPAATCTTPKTCQRYGCGQTLDPAKGHSMSTRTCEKGEVCARCKAPGKGALGHAWSNPTCTAPSTCTRTGCYKQKNDAKGHTVTGATCITNGKCTTCKTTVQGTMTDHVPLTGATCTTNSECRTCGTVLQKALKHNYVDGVCTRCDDPEEYKVSFNLNGGDGGQYMNTITVTYNRVYGDLPKLPTQNGKVCIGWYTEASGGTKVTKDTIVTKTKNHTLYAQWRAARYTIRFDANGGTGYMSSLLASYGSSICLTENAYKRTNYRFTGWNTKADGTGTAYSNGASVKNLTNRDGVEVLLYAQWTNEYQIIFYDNGGSGGPGSQTGYTGQRVKLSSVVPKQAGKVFKGWSVDAVDPTPEYSAGEQFPREGDYYISINNQDNVNLYAVWDTAVYKVNVEINGETETKEVNSGDIFVLPKDEPKGYELRGWSRNAGNVSGEQLTNPGTAIKVTSDLYFRAVIVPKVCTLKYNMNGGEGKTSQQTFNYGNTVTIHSETPKRTGYRFLGYAVGDSVLIEYMPGDTFPKDNIDKEVVYEKGTNTLTARWETAVCKVKVEIDGETKIIEVNYGDTYVLPKDEPKGYELRGWSRNAGNVSGEQLTNPGTAIKVTSDLYFRAVIVPKVCTLKYDMNGGEGKTSQQTFNYGNTVTIHSETPKRTGYRFLGYAVGDSVLIEYMPGDTFPKDNIDKEDIYEKGTNTLTARWEKVRDYTVTFHPNGSSESQEVTEKVRQEDGTGYAQIYPPTFSRSGYRLVGWSTSAGNYGNIDYDHEYASIYGITVTGNMNLYARWEKETQIIYKLNGGKWVDATNKTTFSEGETIKLNAEPKKDQYHAFLGWSLEGNDGLVTHPLGSTFPDENDCYYNDYKDKDTVTLHAVWAPIADGEMIMALQEEYGEQAMRDEYFLSVQEPSAWRPLGNGAWGIVRTTVEIYDGSTYYYSTVYVIHKYEDDIRIEAYGSFGRFKELIELRCLEYDSNFGLLIITGTRLLDNVIMEDAKTWLHAGEKAYLLSKDCIVYIDSVIELAAKCITGEEDLSTYVSKVDATKIVYKRITLPYNTVRSYIDVIASIEDMNYVRSLAAGSDSTNRMIKLCTDLEKIDESKEGKAFKNFQLLAGCILDVADIWALAYDSNMQNLDVNGDNDVVVAYAMNMIRDAGFSENAVNDTVNALANVYAGR